MSKRRVVALVQARMASSRLPGKVLLDIAGKPMLTRVIERAGRAAKLDHVVVATTTDSSDDVLAQFCAAHEYPYWRGNQFDVLDRYTQAARHFEADVVVRITADCPVIDPGIVDQVVALLQESGADFAANRLPPPFHRTFPIGLDTEVCTFAALERAWNEARLAYQREHVMPYLYDTPGRFKVEVLNTEPDYGHLRWTVDTPQDLAVVRRVYEHFAPQEHFGYQELLDYYLSDPALQQMNAGVQHKTMTEVDERAAGREGEK